MSTSSKRNKARKRKAWHTKLKDTADKAIESGEAINIYMAARGIHRKRKCLVKPLQEAILETGSTHYIKAFADNVNHCDKVKLRTVWKLLGGERDLVGFDDTARSPTGRAVGGSYAQATGRAKR